QVLGAYVVVAKRAGVLGRHLERTGGRSGQAERRLTRRRVGERSESLLGRLLAGAERAADVVPARTARACRIDEVIEQLVAPRAQLAGQLAGRGQALERRAGPDPGGEPVDGGDAFHPGPSRIG